MSFWFGWRPAAAKASTVFWILAVLATSGLSWLVPPIQSPDEDSHISRAYMISQGVFLLHPLPPEDWGAQTEGDSEQVLAFKQRSRQHGGRIGGFVDLGLLDFISAHLDLARQSEKRFSAAEQTRLSHMNWSDTTRFQILPGTGYYFPAIYTPQAVGLAIGRQLGLPIAHTYYLARALTLLACLAILGVACRLLTPNPLAAAVLVLPMTLFQMLSPTIDGLTASIAVLAISLFLKSADSDHKQSAQASWGLVICIFLLATSRTHLLPMLILPFYLAWRHQSRRDVYAGCAVAAATLAWVLFALLSTNDPRIARSFSTTTLLLQYATHPAAYFQMVCASLADPALFTFYQESFIGILGWLDTRLPEYFYPALWTGLGLCAVVSVSPLRQDWGVRLLLFGIAATSAGLVFLALLVTWTQHPATLIQGVQGRYFVIPMILLGYALSGFSIGGQAKRTALAGLVLGAFATASLTALTLTLLSRYH